jgi:hypothetical protein
MNDGFCTESLIEVAPQAILWNIESCANRTLRFNHSFEKARALGAETVTFVFNDIRIRDCIALLGAAPALGRHSRLDDLLNALLQR